MEIREQRRMVVEYARRPKVGVGPSRATVVVSIQNKPEIDRRRDLRHCPICARQTCRCLVISDLESKMATTCRAHWVHLQFSPLVLPWIEEELVQ